MKLVGLYKIKQAASENWDNQHHLIITKKGESTVENYQMANHNCNKTSRWNRWLFGASNLLTYSRLMTYYYEDHYFDVHININESEREIINKLERGT